MRPYPVTSSLQRRKKRGGQAVTVESRAAFARRLGVARSTVTRAAQDGRLVLVGEEIDVEASLARWHATAGARSDVAARHAAQRGAPLPGASQPQGKPAEAPQEAASGLELPETPSDTGRTRYKAMALHYENQAIKLQMALNRGRRHRLAAVKREALALGATLRSAIERLIDQTAPRLAGGLDILVIQGTVISAEHVSSYDKPLDLNEFIAGLDIPVIVGGCCSYQGALHLMRTGAVGVLVGVGPGHACTSRRVLGIGVPQCTAIADAAAARMRHLDETGVYCHVIADGGMRTGGDLAKAIACGADSVMIGSPLAAASEAPGRGYHWGMATFHPDLPRGTRVFAGQKGTLADVLVGPAHENDGTLNLCGGLLTSMATCGYENLKAFQKAEVMVAPALQTEGKTLQQAQGVGMGR